MSSDLPQQPFRGARQVPWAGPKGLESVLATWRSTPSVWRNVVLDETQPESAARSVDIPSALHPDVTRALRARGGGWLRLPERPAVAVNLAYAPLATGLRDGDEVAFLPPVSGG